MVELLVQLVAEHQLVVLLDPTVAQSLVLAIVENDFQKITFLPFFMITFCNKQLPPIFSKIYTQKKITITAKRCREILKKNTYKLVEVNKQS